MKKRYFACMLAAGLLIGSLAGCADKGGSSGASEGKTETKTESAGSESDAKTEPARSEPEEKTETGSEASEAGYGDAADWVFTGGYVYTEDEKQPEAEAFAVKDGRFVFVGKADDEALKALTGKDTRVVDLDGKMVTPNLIDAHTHPATVAMTEWCDSIWDETIEGTLEAIRDVCKKHPAEEKPYLQIKCYPTELFGKEGPKKELLDEIDAERPILVSDFNDHAAWVNSRWLEVYGAYDAKPGDRKITGFVRDESGDFTGWIQEVAWNEYMDEFYEKLGWRPPIDCTEAVMSLLTDDLKKWGETAVFDAYLEQELQIKTISEMDKAGKLNMYYDMSVMMPTFEDLEPVISRIHELDEKYGTDHVTMDTIKIFYDGTNEIGTSALVDGTVKDPDYHGELLLDKEQTRTVIRRANEEGIDVHFHLVGDLAFRQVCDCVEELQKELGGPLDIQVEMCHCEYVNPEDYGRPAELGIIINWTPHWSGGYFGEAAREYLGDDRFDNMYQFNPIIESGACVTFGSDVYSWDEEHRANPYFGMQTAMTRVDIELPLESNGGLRLPESAKISLEDLLRGYTIQAARQLRIDDRTGSIETGKYANFNIYGGNLFDIAPEKFKDVMPESVFFEGNLISGSAQDAE